MHQDLKPISKIASRVQASTTLVIDSMFKDMKASGIDVVGFGAGEPDFPRPSISSRLVFSQLKTIKPNIHRHPVYLS